jgi:hypothetical protein
LRTTDEQSVGVGQKDNQSISDQLIRGFNAEIE